MGCGPSKIDQEENVANCKDRKRFIREGVAARHGLAAAHSAYAVSLKNTGAALSDYAQGESVISDIHRAHNTLAITSYSGRVVANAPADKIYPPPPPDSAEGSELMAPLRSLSSAPLVAVSKDKGKAPMNALVTEEEFVREYSNVDEPVPPLSLPVHETVNYVFQDTTHGYSYKQDNETAHIPPPPPPPPKMKGKIVTLLHVLNQLDDQFLKASASAHNVLRSLEAVRMHYHSNFANNRDLLRVVGGSGSCKASASASLRLRHRGDHGLKKLDVWGSDNQRI